MWTAVPLLCAPVAAYVMLAAAFLPRGLKGDAAAALARPLLTVSAPSGALWPVSAGDALVLGALMICSPSCSSPPTGATWRSSTTPCR